MISQQNIIERGATLRSALGQLNDLSGSDMTLFVVDSTDTLRLLGTLTNGDVRRALLNGTTLDENVTVAMHTGFKRLRAGSNDNVDRIRDIRDMGIRLVPVVSEDGVLTDIIDLNRTQTLLPLSAILMAGGKGERLRPMTLTTPKPLLEVGGKAIIDYNVEALARSGITDITVAAGYLADVIQTHFAEPVAGVAVKCVVEDRPLGTIGAATLVSRSPEGNTLVMNSDLLTTVSFEDMYMKHRSLDADVTVGVIPYQVSVPYAILTTDGDDVRSIKEKPAFSHYANAGIYIFSNKLLNTLPEGVRTDATELIEQAIEDGRRVVYHVINGTWIDIGSPIDFRQAQELMRHHRNMLKN